MFLQFSLSTCQTKSCFIYITINNQTFKVGGGGGSHLRSPAHPWNLRLSRDDPCEGNSLYFMDPGISAMVRGTLGLRLGELKAWGYSRLLGPG